MSNLRLEYRDPKTLPPNPHNWRKHPQAQKMALRAALARVGWAGAVLFNERTGRLVDGHARLEDALAQGETSVPTLIGDWSEDDEKFILTTLDPLGGMAETDGAALQKLLSGLDQAGAGNKALAGLQANLKKQSERAIFKDSDCRPPKSTIGRGYNAEHVEIYQPKLLYRLQAAAVAGRRNALELYAGAGHLTNWYRPIFERIITVDQANFENTYRMKAAAFIQSELPGLPFFDFVDFDDEGSPVEEIKAYMRIMRSKPRRFVLALTDGIATSFKISGDWFPSKYLLTDSPDKFKSTREDLANLEKYITCFLERVGAPEYKVTMLSCIQRQPEQSAVYATALFDPA